jgi:uncharacterized glyoxalase superfamily protein PhnB
MIVKATAVLRVENVERTIEWYKTHLGFESDPFPDKPPYEFAMIFNLLATLMVRRHAGYRRSPDWKSWDLYLNLSDESVREYHAKMKDAGLVVRDLQRMPYGMIEFDIADPDGHIICLGGLLQDAGDIPTPFE